MTETKEMSVIERAARALCEAQGYAPNENEMARAVEEVRVVLQAIREPNEAMVEAGMDYDERELNIRLGRPPTVEECQAGEWQAMIDTALSE